jgi:DNA repair protein RadD
MRSRRDQEARLLREKIESFFPAIQEREEATSAQDSGSVTPPQRVVLSRGRTSPPLFDYQDDLAEAIVREALPGVRLLLSLPTGAGKTRTAVVAVLRGMVREGRRNCAWLAPSVELIDQAFSSFETIWFAYGAAPDVTLTRGLVEEPYSRTECSIALLTPQTIYSRVKRGAQIGHWDIVVFDEAHQLGARTFRAAAEALIAASPGSKPPPLVGLSATPGRVDERETEDLVTLFGGRLLTSPILSPDPVRALQRRGVLAELQFRKFTERAVPNEDEPQRLVIAARACMELSKRGRRVLVFTGSVAAAIVLADALRSKGVPAAAVHSETPSEDRRQRILDFERGKTHVLTNQRVLATGYDCPAVTDVAILPRISSPILFEQIVGRAARGPRTGGWRTATVWDFDDHLKLHGRPQSYYRYRDFDWA